MPQTSGHPVRVLAIAPYDAMTTAIRHAAESFPGLRVDAHTGDLEQGVEIVRKLGTQDYDVVLSRGGTAEMIREVTELPVVEIPVSIYDILRTIKLAENYTDSCAIAGYSGVAENAYTLCNLLRLKIPIETVRESGDIIPILERFRSRNIHTVICDMVTYRQARAMGFNTMLLTSGENSIREALDGAEKQGGVYRSLRNEIMLLQALLGVDSDQCLVLNEKREPVMAFGGRLPEDLAREMRRHVSDVPATGAAMFYHYTGGALHTVTGYRVNVRGLQYICFRDQPRQIPLRTMRPGIRAYSWDECEHLLSDSFFSISGSMGALEQKLNTFSAARHSILIVGEEGTGKEQIARALYLRSRLKNNPFLAIDGARLNERAWEYLLERDSSPLCDTGITVFMRHMEEAPVHRQKALISIIEETALDRRLWLIFACDENDGQPLSDFSRRLSNLLAPLTLDLPTLRSRRDEIPALSSIYLNNLNVELGKQLAGFEPDAMGMLMSYEWPGNYTQFKHVLKELAVAVGGPYISAADVAELLARERRQYRPAMASATADALYSGTLDEITERITQHVLNANHGNQTQTAKQLNISRTTLWRILARTEK